MLIESFLQAVPQLNKLLAALAQGEIEWALADRERVLYITPGMQSMAGLATGMSTSENPWLQEVLLNNKRLIKRMAGWKGNSDLLSLVVGVPLQEDSGETAGVFLYITHYQDRLVKAENILRLLQEMSSEENLVTALKIFTSRSLDFFDCTMAGIWLWQDGKFRLLSASAATMEQEHFLVTSQFPDDFGIQTLNGPQIEECADRKPMIRDLDELAKSAWRQELKEFGVKKILCVQLAHFGQMLGVLTLFANLSQSFNEESINWLKQVIPLISSFVYEQQLRQALLEREQALNLLLRGTEILVQAESEEQLLTEAGEMAMEILFLQAGFFLMQDQAGNWQIRAPFGRLKHGDLDWQDWVKRFIFRDNCYIPHQNRIVFSLGQGPENSFGWEKVLIQPLHTHNGVVGELWLLDTLEHIDEQRQEILAAFVRGIGVALETIRQRQELERLATIDCLTGILNRQGFEQRLREEMAGTLRRESSFLLLILDLDSFKQLNDTTGHPAGDRALKVVAQNLKASVREHDIVARTGGDEFTVILTDLRKGPEALQIIERMKNNMALGQFGLGVSIGVAEFPAEGRDYEELYRLADQRLYQGKKAGKGKIVL